MKDKIKKYWFSAVVFLVLITAFISLTYTLLSSATTKIVVSNITELSEHDMKNIRDFVDDRRTILLGEYRELMARNPATADDLLDELNIKSASMDYDHLYLIGDDGRLYTDTHTVYEKEQNVFLEYFNGEKMFFAQRFNNKQRYSELGGEYMFYGMNLSNAPITLSGESTKFVGMVLLNDIAKIRERMRISSFDGRGYSSVIDQNGKYIIPDANDPKSSFDGFFERVRNGKLSGMTPTEIIKNISQYKNCDFWYTGKDGSKKFVMTRPIADLNWTFIVSLEKSVFTDQTKQFILLTTIIIVILSLILIIIAFYIHHASKKLKTIYHGVVSGVFNRKYYDDKIENSHVKAIAIIDLDHLKTINDTYGHLAGDLAIEQTALTVLRNVSPHTEVLRFGGDEFVAAFRNNISPENFRQLLENMLSDIRKTSIPSYPGLKLTFSIGGCCREGTASEVLADADKLLYEAKKKRNCVVTGASGAEENK